MIVQLLILTAALKLFANKVFVAKVFENAALGDGYWKFFKYLAQAFFQTNIVVQLTVLFTLGIGALLLRDLARVAVTYIRTIKKR